MRRPLFWLAALLVLILAVLIVMQLVLPGIATTRIRDRLSKSGRVLKVEVHAFPAVKLLWDDAGPLVLHNASLSKRGDQVSGTATITDADVRAALPILTSVSFVGAANGQLILQGTASAFGLSVNLQVVVSAQNGDLVAAPNVPFGGLATITVFSNPHLTVEGVSGQPAAGGFTATATGQLR